MDVTHLEEELAHLRRSVENMNAELVRRGAEIDRLTRQVTLLMERAAEADAEQGGTAVFADPPPPHY